MGKVSQLAVVIDQSRDGIWSREPVSLYRDPRFHVTENERRLTGAMLKRCDVLVIQSCAAASYTANELSAVRKFVRGGGGLLLTTVAGAFELNAGRPVAESAAQQVAALFKVRFLSPDAAAGKTTPGESLFRGYRRRDLALSGSGPLKGFRLEDLAVGRSAPLALPGGARSVLRHRKTGEAVAAALRYGRGRVVAANVDGFGRPWETVGAGLVRWLGAGSRRARNTPAPPERLAAASRASKRGALAVRIRGVSRKRAESVLRLTDKIAAHVKGMLRRKRPVTWNVEILPGTGCRFDWNWRTERSVVRIGAGTCEPSLIYGLACALGRRWQWSDGTPSLMGLTISSETLTRHLALRLVGDLGHGALAAEWRAVLEAWPDGKGDPRRIDLARWRAEAGPSPAMWIWRALEEELGSSSIDRFVRAQPKKFPWKKFPHWDVVTEFDIIVYYLSLAAKRDLFKWFAARGMTVHPLPLVSTDDKAFMRRCLANIRRQFRDVSQPLSERFDAARVMMRARIHKRVNLAREVKALRSADEADRLVAAMRLARTRDPRGKAVLLRLAQRARDEAHAAIAAITLAEMGDGRAADRLGKLARSADARFQLDARAALMRLGRDIPSPLRVVVRREDAFEGGSPLEYVGEIDGYAGANVFSCPGNEPWPGGVVVPRHYVEWVQTAPKWRRKGISRALLLGTLADRSVRRAATSALDTGTTSLAHPLYRSAGFIDTWVWDDWRRPLKGAVRAPRAKDVRLRVATDKDVGRMAALFNDVYQEYFNVRRARGTPLSPNDVAVIAASGKSVPGKKDVPARKKGELLGYVRGTILEPNDKGKVESRICDVCVRSAKDTEQIARALVARFCTEAAGRGASLVKTWHVPEDEAVRRGFQAVGFTTKKDGGVEMWRMNNLPMLLECIRPLLERRLAKKKRNDWCGTIAIRAGKHSAALRIRRGTVRVLKKAPVDADIAIETDDDTLSRVVVGRETPFEAMLQLRLRISPKANRDVTTLLDCLFPRVKMYPPG